MPFPEQFDKLVERFSQNRAKDIIEYRVFDAMGKMVLTNTNVANNKVIDLSTEPNGIYILQVISENGQATQKLVKQ